jgi:uncharacterized protein
MAGEAPADPASLLDWRRRVHELYAAVRRAADPAAGHATWARGRTELFAEHPQSPIAPALRSNLELPVAAYDPAWRFECPLEPAEPEHRAVETGTDGTVHFDRIGTVRLGEHGTLDVWWLAAYGGGVFVPLRDGTAGRTTYGGGRYVLDTVKGADLGSSSGSGATRIIVDLNFAYHPSCAYDPLWACPLAPAGNVLAVDVPVGEQLPAGGWY